MNVALLAKYSRLGASSRLRSLQFLPALQQAGIEVTPHALFDDAYLKRLYGGEGRSLAAVARRYAQRAKQMRRLRQADLIWLEKEALPYVPYWLERGLMPRGVPYVVDYDDAVFHQYDLSSRRLVRRLLGNKIDKVMAGASAVICGNDYLAERARQAGARRIERVPTVVDANRYSVGEPPGAEPGRAPVIGWIGSPSTQRYVLALKPVLEALHREHGVRLVLVGAQPQLAEQFGKLPVEVLPWAEESEAQAIAGFDIGIMPLPDGPWERGKCGYKLIQYMAAGKPVVASSVGVNVEIVQGWQCGELADEPAEWQDALSGLLLDAAKRRALGQSGRQAVEQHFSLQAQAPRLAEILRSAAREG
ncbi:MULTISPECIES: glycosyltransferase family 4 protein [Halomonas]|uniref:Glycosyltransferase involved in cell wall biosynthesis n=1 Tax=Halomonas ventosae TaxID=229007 RepID=A0A4R6I3S5_9GAMM|nr:glycosyltransferase family 4 protein [Halomonas ventosae]TDO16643.1 glycosyltransferase involved in cell wall biosynthesis [Halomonas ventosae]